jgi:hypothetical protein
MDELHVVLEVVPALSFEDLPDPVAFIVNV